MIPLLTINGKIIPNFKKKANLFNRYFWSQCKNPLPNDSKLPKNQAYITETNLSSFDIQDEDIYKIIKTLDINKAYEHDGVSIRMLKMCDKSIVKPLSNTFKKCKPEEAFPNLCKKANVFLIYKKGEETFIKGYRPFPLLLIFEKFFERLIFSSLFKYIDGNELLNPNQSDFCPFSSCVNQILSINDEIFQIFTVTH